MTYLIGAVLLAVCAGLIWHGLRAGAARQAARAVYFGDVLPVMQGARARVEVSGFQRLAGEWGGGVFDLQAVPDSLTFRKLPVLWVMVTLTEDMPVKGPMHLMMRPLGSEVFSKHGQMPVTVALPPGFPAECVLACEAAADLPLAVLAGQAGLFADRDVKELVISPKGLRIVIRAEEADRGRFLIYRDAELGLRRLEVGRILPYMEALIALRTRLLEGENG